MAIFASEENKVHVNGYSPDSWCFVVAVSGVLAEKTAGSKEKFNNLVAVGKRAKNVIEAQVYKSYASLGEAFQDEKVVSRVCSEGRRKINNLMPK